MLTWSGAWSRLIILAAVATVILAVLAVQGPLRPAVTLFFALTCPGMALIRLLGLRDPLVELSLGIALSVAIAGLVGGGLLYFGLWSPEGGLAILIMIAAVGLAGERAAATSGISGGWRQAESGRDGGPPTPTRSSESSGDGGEA